MTANFSPTAEAELRALEEGALDPAKFPHAEHVRFAFLMLQRHGFAEALLRFSRALKLLVTKAGKPEKYHETMTVAFLALIAERRGAANGETWEEFIARNADLLDKDLLLRWYPKEQLQSELARNTFCLPPPRT